ncbi:MAG: cytochrome C552, partial [Pseudomonadota bacterium]
MKPSRQFSFHTLMIIGILLPTLLLLNTSALAAKVTLGPESWGHEEGKACIDCHSKSSAGLTHQWKQSAHAEANVNCMDCHQAYEDDVDAMEHEGSVIATIVSPKDCGRCHETEFKE